MADTSNRYCPAIVFAIVCVVSGWGWGSAEACSCVHHLRKEIFPLPGAAGVPLNVSIRFSVGGSAGTKTEEDLVGSYLLQEVDEFGVAIDDIRTSQRLVGNRVVISPDHDLSLDSRYRLALMTDTGKQVVTEFETGAAPVEPRLKAIFEVSTKLDMTPNLVSVVGFPVRPPTTACGGHTQGYSVTLRVPFETPLDPDHYDWLIEDRRADGSLAIAQRFAIGQASTRAWWGEQWQEYHLVMGHSQCGSGPEPQPGKHVVVVSLVGLGEIAWTTGEIEVEVP